ncbi:MAG TPA: hypothetical protein PLC53_01230 [Bacilli bacterium]|nr:hypothetical protein [Bacilli bacterium]
MKRKILIVLLCLFTLAIPVYAQNTDSGSDSTTSGNVLSGSNNDNGDTAQEAKELRVIIRTQTQQLATLRNQLKTQLEVKQELMLQYREQEQLTDEQKEEVKEMIQTLAQVQTKLGEAYSNAVKALNSYKGDSSENKIDGLNAVITSQQERIALLQEAIDDLS